jgi:signal peptidase II
VKKNYYLLILPAVVIIVLDQISKFLIVRSMHIFESIPVISGFFNLVHIRNRGMAFGLMNRLGSDFNFYFLVAATIVAITLLAYWFSRLKSEERKLILGLSLILGGAIGNLIDRLRFHEVIDFLDFYIGPYHWPAFNVADSVITVGTFWVAGNILFWRPPNAKGA